MKKLILFLSAALILASCATKDDLAALNARIDSIENTSIATLEQQVHSIKISIGNLEETDKELKGYIQNLQSTAAELQKSINTNNEKIDKVEKAIRDDLKKSAEDLAAQMQVLDGKVDNTKLDLANDIITAKSDVLSQLESLQGQMNKEYNQINATLESLTQKDNALDKRIDNLKAYVDTEIKSAKDWSTATFSTLEQYNKTVEEISGIKADIEGLNSMMQSLETRLNEKIANDIANAVSGLQEEIAQQVKVITQSYQDAISKAKGEMESAYTEAIQNAIAITERTMQAWVNGRLTGYYTISEADAKLAAVKSDLEGQIAAQESYFEAMVKTLSDQLGTRISANESAISQLRTEIADISDNVAENARLILVNSGKIQENASAIAENARLIAANDLDNESLHQLVEGNTEAIAENARLISENNRLIQEANLSISAADVVANTAEITRHATLIAANADNIAGNAELIAKNAKGIADNADAITANANDISSLRIQLSDAKSELTDAYSQAIAAAIANLDGKLSSELLRQIASADDKITSLESRINGHISIIEGRISSIETTISSIQSDIATLRTIIDDVNNRLVEIGAMIQSINIIPSYNDGSVAIRGEDPSEFNFEIRPPSVTEKLLDLPLSNFSLYSVYTETKADIRFIPLTVNEVIAKDGILTLSVIGDKLDLEFFTKEIGASAQLSIENSITSISSSFFPLTPIGAPRKVVDLGLSVKWAALNLGATNLWDHGEYYTWGNVEYPDKGSSFSDVTELPREYDIAAIMLGDSWRIPTNEECQELIDNTTSTSIIINGNSYLKVKSNITDQAIVLPAFGGYWYTGGSKSLTQEDMGCFWTSTKYPQKENGYTQAFYFYFYKDRLNSDNLSPARIYKARSVRPVLENKL